MLQRPSGRAVAITIRVIIPNVRPDNPGYTSLLGLYRFMCVKV